MRGGRTSKRGGAWTNVLLLLASTLLSLAVAELAARAYWRLVFHASFLHPDRVLYAFYPELKDVNRLRPSRDGTNTMPAGPIAAMYWASWPAPERMRR